MPSFNSWSILEQNRPSPPPNKQVGVIGGPLVKSDSSQMGIT